MTSNVGQRTRAAFPATVAVIEKLAATFELHTATGNPSWRIEPMLQQWGVRGLFGVLAGSDLVGVMKDSDAFHPAVFALAGIDAADAIVVDDRYDMLERARRHGARTVLVGDDGGGSGMPPGASGTDVVIANIAGLPAALRRLERGF